MTIPKWALTCVMSALSKDTVDGNENDDDATNSKNNEEKKQPPTKTFHFYQPPDTSHPTYSPLPPDTSPPVPFPQDVTYGPNRKWSMRSNTYEFAQVVEQFF